jgi:hypothetical protein
MTDPIVDEVRRVREELIERHGGLDAYLRYCEQQDRRAGRGGKEPPQMKRARRPAAAPRKLAKKRE